MKQLGILDSAFINLEHPNTPQHVGGMGIYDPSTAPGGFVRFKDVIANFERRLLRFPMFRSRLVHAPGQVDRPYFIQDANFDVEYHIRHIALPEPGDWRQLCIQVARLHARPLDMSRPLWEVYIIEGVDNIPNVPDGGFAVYSKMHHSLVDGAGGASFMSAIHDLTPDPGPDAESTEPLIVDAPPSRLQLGLHAARNQTRNTFNMAKGSFGLLRDVVKMADDIRSERVQAPPVTGPKTRFNAPVGPYRVFDAAEFALADIKTIKDAAGAKINDVVLGIVAGGMRRYLDSKGELPQEALSCSIPLNMRTRVGETGDNNQVASALVPIHTDEAEPLARIRKISIDSKAAQKFGESSPMGDMLKVAGFMPPLITKPIVRLYINGQMSRHMPVSTATVVSNVPGPNFPLYCAGAEMRRYYGMGLLTPGVGLFHLAFSSNGVLSLSVLADRDQMPDPAFYRECLMEEYAAMVAAVGASVTLANAISEPAADEGRSSPKPAPKKKAPVRKKAAAKGAPLKKAAPKKAAPKKAAPKKAAAKKAPAAAADPV